MLQSRVRKTEQSAMIDILFVLAVLTFMSFFYYGARAIIVVVISILASVATDVICIRLRKKKYNFKDLSAIVSGAVLALMMPASVPYGILILTDIIAIVIGKQIFGGRGKNIFNCVAVGFIFSSYCWKDAILMYPKPTEHLELISHVTNTLYPSLTQTLGIATTPAISNTDIMLGNFIGPMGTTHIIIILVCAIVLMLRRSISALTFCSGLGTILIFSYLFPKFGNSAMSSVYYELVSGMMVYGLIFLAGDYYTGPKTRSSRFLYGVLIGILTITFRHIGNVENPIVYAVLVANPLSIPLDRSTLSFSKISREIIDKIKAFFRDKMKHMIKVKTVDAAIEANELAKNISTKDVAAEQSDDDVNSK